MKNTENKQERPGMAHFQNWAVLTANLYPLYYLLQTVKNNLACFTWLSFVSHTLLQSEPTFLARISLVTYTTYLLPWGLFHKTFSSFGCILPNFHNLFRNLKSKYDCNYKFIIYDPEVFWNKLLFSTFFHSTESFF